MARDIWSSDPDRTTARGDTRTSEQVAADTFPAAQGHGYIFNDDGREVWASCTCGWAESGARHGDRRWREYATACAWDIHCENVGVR